GLSATVQPIAEAARFLGGYEASSQPRPVAIVDAGASKQFDLKVEVPVEELAKLGEGRDGATGGEGKRQKAKGKRQTWGDTDGATGDGAAGRGRGSIDPTPQHPTPNTQH